MLLIILLSGINVLKLSANTLSMSKLSKRYVNPRGNWLKGMGSAYRLVIMSLIAGNLGSASVVLAKDDAMQLATQFDLARVQSQRSKAELESTRIGDNIDANSADPLLSDYLISEKFDGVRGRWDGRKMWSRSGRQIPLPNWFTIKFPEMVLDGELWAGREHFDLISGLVRTTHQPEALWKSVKFMVFDAPLVNGLFNVRYQYLTSHLTGVSPYLDVIPQTTLSDLDSLYARLEIVVAAGGEGLMLHKKSSFYLNGRNPDLMKLKPYFDAEAKVVGYQAGKGKYQGMLGSLTVETPDGVRFQLGSGLSDAQRLRPPVIGTIITYKYLGVTETGKPRFASFLRVRLDSAE